MAYWDVFFDVPYRTVIEANSFEEAREKFWEGDYVLDENHITGESNIVEIVEIEEAKCDSCGHVHSTGYNHNLQDGGD